MDLGRALLAVHSAVGVGVDVDVDLVLLLPHLRPVGRREKIRSVLPGLGLDEGDSLRTLGKDLLIAGRR